jgi:hypothetical protein
MLTVSAECSRRLAFFFAKAGIDVALANTRGPQVVESIAKNLGGKISAKSLEEWSSFPPPEKMARRAGLPAINKFVKDIVAWRIGPLGIPL